MHNRHHLKTYILIGIMIITGPVGNLLIAKAMRPVGKVSLWPLAQLLPVVAHAAQSLTLWAGIACLITFTVAYMLALSLADYSFVQPAAALGYVVIAVLGIVVLGESVSLLHWAGIAVICLGVSVIRGTNPRTTESSN